jgi:polar amino acid transport system substrate-binding protein
MLGCSGDREDKRILTSAAQMNAPGYSIGVPQGAAAMTAAEKKFPKSKIKYYNSVQDAYLAVAQGKIDAFAYDRHTLQYATMQNPDLALMDEKIGDEFIVVGTALGQKDLMEKVNTFIRQYRADGTYTDMSRRWLQNKNAKMPDLAEPKKPVMSLKIGTYGIDEPMNYYADGRLTGFDIEFSKRLALFLNADIKFQTMEFPALIAAASTGKIDLVVANLNVTAERREKMLFSDTYLDSEISLLVRKDRLPPTTKGKPITNLETISGNSFFSGFADSFRRTFIIEDRYKLVLQGLEVTILISVFSAIFGTLLGFGVCMLRRAGSAWAYVPAKVFIRAIQGTPIIVLLMILYYIVFGSVDISGIVVAIIGFSINFAAYVSEMMRTGIDAVDKGQHEAAAAIGFSKFQVYTLITFPQAARHVLPVFKGEFISMIKMTSVVGYIAIQDLTKMSDIIRSRTYEAFFPLIATALIYFAIAYVMTYLLSLIEISIDPKRRERVVKGVVRP